MGENSIRSLLSVMRLCWVLLFLPFIIMARNDQVEQETPWLPLQFSAEVEITSHLVDPAQEYPARTRRLWVHYDYTNQLARADIVEGYEEGKTYIRRYDQKREYMIVFDEHGGECQRAYLGESMPVPALPSVLKYQGIQQIEDQACRHWLHETDLERIHYYDTAEAPHRPVRVMDESLWDGTPTPMLSFEFKRIKLERPQLERFHLPSDHTHDQCLRTSSGFPYLEVFNQFIRF